MADVMSGFVSLGEHNYVDIRQVLAHSRYGLKLRIQNLMPKELKVVVDELVDNKTVVEIYFSRNYIREEGAEHIAKMLRANDTLKKLTFWMSCIGDAGIVHIANALKTNKSICSLKISADTFKTNGANCIADMLKAKSTIQFELFVTFVDKNSKRIPFNMF